MCAFVAHGVSEDKVIGGCGRTGTAHVIIMLPTTAAMALTEQRLSLALQYHNTECPGTPFTYVLLPPK